MKRRGGILIYGSGLATVKIYTIGRTDGYSQYTLSWREYGKNKRRSIASIEEARLLAQQTVVRLQNGTIYPSETSLRDIEMLHHCEAKVKEFNISLIAAIEEWVEAKHTVQGTSLILAARFFAAKRTDQLPVRLLSEVLIEFIESRKDAGLSNLYLKSLKSYITTFVQHHPVPIADVTSAHVEGFLKKRNDLGPVTRNNIKKNLITLFRFARQKGYLPETQKTAPEYCGTFKVNNDPVEIFTPEEMRKILAIAQHDLIPFLSIGAFAGIRSAEIQRLTWEEINWERGHILISGRKSKTAARRLVPLTENLRVWLSPWRTATGLIVTRKALSVALCELGARAGVGGWRQNALRHSYVSYRVAQTGDVARTALECGNSPEKIFKHYREVVTEAEAKEWFSILPPM